MKLMNSGLLIRNITLYSNTEDPAKYDILTVDGKISRIFPAGELKDAVDSIDAGGGIAIPGMIDIHIHGAGGADSLEGTCEAFHTISRTLAGLGTTSFLSAMVVTPGKENPHLRAAAACSTSDMGGAVLLGAYIEGPFINPEKRGGILSHCITKPSIRILEEIIEEADGSLKMMVVAPELPGIKPLIDRLLNKNIIAAFGHSDAGYEETVNGFRAGISHVTHLFNAMRPVHHRDPGPLPAIFDNPDISVELIADTHHVHPALFKMVWNLKGPGKVACITDGISGMGLPEGVYLYNNQKYTSKDGLARYLDGTFIGSTTGLGDIAMNFIKNTGCSFREAVDTVTIVPARVLGIDNRKGSLEEGKDADIVIVDRELKPKYTIIAGKIVFKN
jgi:N-acetylglucosamine-6-phosphate deacetylase